MRTRTRKNPTTRTYQRRIVQRLEANRSRWAREPAGTTRGAGVAAGASEGVTGSILTLRDSATFHEDVRDVLAAVRDYFQRLVELLELDDAERVRALQKLLKRAVEEVVRQILEAVHLDRGFEDGVPAFPRPHRPQGGPELLYRLDDDVREGDHRLRGLLDPVDREAGRGRVDVVEDVVERRREPAEVLLRERGHERPVQVVVEAVDDLVRAVLDVLDLLPLRGHVPVVLEEVPQRLRPLRHGGRLPLEEVEELGLLRGHPFLQRHVLTPFPPPVAGRASLRFS